MATKKKIAKKAARKVTRTKSERAKKKVAKKVARKTKSAAKKAGKKVVEKAIEEAVKQNASAPISLATNVHYTTNDIRQNLHKNLTFAPKRLYSLTNLPGGALTSAKQFVAGQEAIRQLLAAADADCDNPRVRALGSGWSLSTAAVTKDWLTLTKGMPAMILSLKKESLAPGCKIPGLALAWVQTGTLVAALNLALGGVGRSLPTTGASNGQTFVGAFSTNTHGSAVQYGSMQDIVRGMHLMVSGTRHLWIESGSVPILSDTAAKAAFGSDVVILRDDAVFNAALVSFGSFGIIESVIIETEPLFMLTAKRSRSDWTDVTVGLTSLVTDLGRKIANDPSFYHVGVVFDITKPGKPWVTTMTRSDPPPGYTYQPSSDPQAAIVADLVSLNWLALLGGVAPRLVAKQCSKVLEARFPPLTDDTAYPLGHMFRDVVIDSVGATTEIGVAMADSPRAVVAILDVLKKTIARRKPYAGPLAMRFVPPSNATLAFTRYGPQTCCIELPGARLPWTSEIFDKVFAELDAQNIPFSVHWAQEGNVGKNRVLATYGKDAVDAWIAARHVVLDTPELADRFSNPLLEAAGLDG